MYISIPKAFVSMLRFDLFVEFYSFRTKKGLWEINKTVKLQ